VPKFPNLAKYLKYFFSRCDATRDGVNPSTQIGILSAFVLLIILFTVLGGTLKNEKTYKQFH